MRALCLLLALLISAQAGAAELPTAPAPRPAPVPTTAPRLVPQISDNGAKHAVFTPDGRIAVTVSGVYADSKFCVWDVRTGRLIRSWRTLGLDSADAVTVAPDGSRVFVRSGGAFRIYDTDSGAAVFERTVPSLYYTPLAFSPDGSTVLIGSEKSTLTVLSAATGEVRVRLEGHTKPVAAGGYLPNGRGYATASTDGTLRIWGANGKVLHTVDAHEKPVVALAVARDGRVVTMTAHKELKVWDSGTGKLVTRLDIPEGRLGTGLSFSADGRTVAIALGQNGLHVWDLSSGRSRELLAQEKKPPYVPFVALTPDGTGALINLPGGGVGVVDTTTWAVVRRFESRTAAVFAVAVSPDGALVYGAGADGYVRCWDLRSGRPERQFRAHIDSVRALALSPDGDTLLTVGDDKMGRLWDTRTGERLRVLVGHTDRVYAAAISPKGDLALTGGYDNTARLWDVATGKELRRFGPNLSWMHGLAFTPDGAHVVSASPSVGQVEIGSGPDETARLWETGTGNFVRRFERHRISVEAITVSPDGNAVLSGGGDKSARIWELATGKELLRLEGHTDRVIAVTYLPKGKEILTGGQDGVAYRWSVETGKVLTSYTGHTGKVTALAPTPDGKFVVTASSDGTIRVWEVGGKHLATLIGFNDGGWVAATPDGRFDVGSPDDIRGVSWIAPDEPLRPLPPEIFMRDYYEPKLLARAFSGEKLKPIRSLAELNRVQPVVKVADVKPHAEKSDEVIVTVEVTARAQQMARPSGPVLVESGALDLHLFRDGRLVGLREGAVALDPKTGRATITFERVKLPASADKKAVEFSAYAFNTDRVKSDTARLEHSLPVNRPLRKGTAYVVCVGVNAFDEKRWDLRFAVPDAKVMAAVLGDHLKRSGQFEKVVVVSLLSEPRYDKDGARVGTDSTATKENVRAVFAALAGQKPDARLLKSVPAAADLAAARPEDTVILTFSTHGYNGADGQFYLFPSDIGSGHGKDVTDELLKRAVSSDELTNWLRNVDAGEMVAVIDACQSAGSVEQDGFKPGPMGSRGLGQLAYNKRMRILAASQADDVALEDARIGHGLLTYALCKDGLDGGKADFDPPDGQVTLAEWLRFGVRRVPALANEIADGKLTATSATGRSMIRVNGKQKVAQLPSLFDFTRKADNPVLVPVPKK